MKKRQDLDKPYSSGGVAIQCDCGSILYLPFDTLNNLNSTIQCFNCDELWLYKTIKERLEGNENESKNSNRK
jgi:hypothetical protein